MTHAPPVDPTDLDLRWSALGAPTGDRVAAERVRDWAGGPVLAGVDATGARHLLIRFDPDRPTDLPRAAVDGLSVDVRRMHPTGQADAAYIDLASTDPAWRRPFAGLCADVITELPAAGPADTAAIVAVLNRWRSFWNASRDGLSRDEQTGLIGELWLLLEWLPRVTTGAVSAWLGPLRGRHDFVSPAISVEVKTTRSATGPIVHTINGLDQLAEPGGGQLYLLSLRTAADPLGAISLDTLIQRARLAAGAESNTCLGLLEDRLVAAGLRPGDNGRYTEQLRITRQELYRIDGRFPRLTAETFDAGLPAGIVGIDYQLDTSACRPWLVADSPVNSPLSTLI